MSYDPVYAVDPVSRTKTRIVGFVPTEPETLTVTQDQFAALRALASECEDSSSGVFNEDRWVAGVRTIIGHNVPLGPYRIKVQ